MTSPFTRSKYNILLTKTAAAQNEDALSYHSVRGLYFLAVVFVRSIDNEWRIMKVKLSEDVGSITGRAELVQRLQLLWCDITVEKLQELSSSLPRRMALWVNINLKRTSLSFLTNNYLYILIIKLFSINQFVSLVVDSKAQKTDLPEIKKLI